MKICYVQRYYRAIFEWKKFPLKIISAQLNLQKDSSDERNNQEHFEQVTVIKNNEITKAAFEVVANTINDIFHNFYL